MVAPKGVLYLPRPECNSDTGKDRRKGSTDVPSPKGQKRESGAAISKCAREGGSRKWRTGNVICLLIK
jgi:hypothetical protein